MEKSPKPIPWYGTKSTDVFGEVGTPSFCSTAFVKVWALNPYTASLHAQKIDLLERCLVDEWNEHRDGLAHKIRKLHSHSLPWCDLFTRLTNAFSKKVENHAAALAIFYMYYNLVKIHQSLRVTPAMATGVADHLWEIGDLVGLLS